jgi:hypothetical protein
MSINLSQSFNECHRAAAMDFPIWDEVLFQDFSSWDSDRASLQHSDFAKPVDVSMR